VICRLEASLNKNLPFRYDVGLVGQVRGSSISPGELEEHEGFCRFAVEC